MNVQPKLSASFVYGNGLVINRSNTIFATNQLASNNEIYNEHLNDDDDNQE